LRVFDDNKAGTLKAWLVRPGYMFGQSISDGGEDYSEQMAFCELHRRLPLKGNFLITQGIRSDFRWIGENAQYSYRIRYRFMIEKEFVRSKISMVPYFNFEPFYDSRYNSVNRFRFTGGVTVSLKSWLAVEVNLTYQYDEKYSTSNVYATGLIMHYFFENGHR